MCSTTSSVVAILGLLVTFGSIVVQETPSIDCDKISIFFVVKISYRHTLIPNMLYGVAKNKSQREREKTNMSIV